MKNLKQTAKAVFVFLSILFTAPGFAENPPPSDDLRVAGWVERVSIFPGNLKIKAKLDTGARNSSLNATDIDAFERNGAKWVRFDMNNWKAPREHLKAKITLISKTKQSKQRKT
jgi:hypothetical protein